MGTDLHIPPLPYKLRIGVSGHRKLPDEAGTANAVNALLDHIQQILESASEYSHGPGGLSKTMGQRVDHALARCSKLFWRSVPISAHQIPQDRQTPLQWTVVSALARGADRVVAKAVLNRANSRLRAVLPFAVDDYRRDFVEPSDAREFDELLARDPTPTNLQYEYGAPRAGDSESVTKLKQDRRNEGYMAAGRWVADACEILIVIWNGKPAAGYGGTGDVVKYALEQGRMVFWINSESPSTLPLWLAPKSVDGSSDPDKPYTEHPLPVTTKELSLGFHQVAAYNRGAAFDSTACNESYRWQENLLRTHASAAGIDEDSLLALIHRLVPHYAKADQMAIRYQELHTAGAIGVHCLAAAAVSVAVIQLLLFPHATWMILLEVAAMIFAVLLLRINRNEAWHEKWLHNRHFAERLRTACFTSLVPRPDGRERRNLGESLPFYRSYGNWVSRCCDSLVSECERKMSPVQDVDKLKNFLVNAWISDQAKYHKKNAARKHRGVARARYIGLALFLGTLFMALVHLLVPHHADEEHALAAIVMAIVVALSIILPAWGGASQAINTLLERERMAGRSRQMAEVLQQIAQEAEAAKTMDELRSAAEKAQQVMASENQEWMVSLSFRELELAV